MKVKMNREHYLTKDGGKTWQPKESFETIEQMEASGLPKIHWKLYLCSFCLNKHAAKRIYGRGNK
jgi:hypothetical protein